MIYILPTQRTKSSSGIGPAPLPPQKQSAGIRSGLPLILPPFTGSLIRVNSPEEHQLQSMVAEYGRLPANHPSVAYLTALAKKVNPGFDGEIVILCNHPQANAFVMGESKDIFITQKLLNKFNYEEELAFVLSHESVHIQENHTKRKSQWHERTGDTRTAETEADFKGARALDEAGINPEGAVRAMKTLNGKKGFADHTHGAPLDRELNFLSAIPFHDLQNLDHQLTPLPAFLKKTGIQPPLSVRVQEMPLAELGKILKTANYYQLRSMLEGVEAEWNKVSSYMPHFTDTLPPSELKKSQLLQRKELLITRAKEMIGKLVTRNGQPDKFTSICTSFYLHCLGIKEEATAAFSDEEFEWLAGNISILGRGEAGIERINKNNAFGYFRKHVNFFFNNYMARGIKEYLEQRHQSFSEIAGKINTAKSEDEARKYLEGILAANNMEASAYGEEIARQVKSRNYGIAGVSWILFDSRLFSDLSFRSFGKDFDKYFEINQKALNMIEVEIKEALPFFPLDQALQALWEFNKRGDFIDEKSQPFHELLELCNGALRALEKMGEKGGMSLDKLQTFYLWMRSERRKPRFEYADAYSPLLNEQEKERKEEAGVRFKKLIGEECEKRSPHLAGRAMEIVKRLMLETPEAPINSRSKIINLSALSAEEIKELSGVFSQLWFLREHIGLWFLSSNDPFIQIEAASEREIKGKASNLFDRIEGNEEKLKHAFKALLLSGSTNNLLSALGYWGAEPQAKVSLEKLIKLEELYLTAAREVSVIKEREYTIKEMVSSEGYRALARSCLKEFLSGSLSIEEKIAALKRLPSLRSGKLFDNSKITDEGYFKDFVREAKAKASSVDELLLLTFLIPSTLDRVTIQRKIVLEQAKKLAFTEARAFLEGLTDLPQEALYPAVEYVCEKLPTTLEEHQAALEIFEANMRKTDPSKLGITASLDALGYMYLSGLELVKLGLASGTNDKLFRRELFDKWIKTLSGSENADILRYQIWTDGPKEGESYEKFCEEGSSHTQMGYIFKYEKSINYEINEGRNNYHALLETLYGMDRSTRKAFLRRILIGDKGALMQKEERHELAKYLLDYRLNPEAQKDLKETIGEVLGAFMETGTTENIYLLLSPIIEENFMIQPANGQPYHELADAVASEKHAEGSKAFLLDQMNTEKIVLYCREMGWSCWPWGAESIKFPKWEQIKDKREKEIEARWIAPFQGELVRKMSEQIIMAMIGQVVERKDYAALLADQKEKDLLTVFGVQGGDTRPALDPIDLVLKAGTLMGPAGVRFLQLLGQYIDIPAEYREAFDKVYDSMEGQTRLSAYSTFRREAKRGLNRTYFEEVEQLGKRIGGGSLVSVHEVILKDGAKEVLKITNPNALYRAEQYLGIIREVIEHLAKQHPEQAQTYSAVRLLFEDIGEWIVRDVRDERFFENDRKVFADYNQYSNGGAYRLRIPKHRELSGSYIKAEEFIEGHNLTKVRIKGRAAEEKGYLTVSESEYKDIVCLLTQTYFRMISKGLAHSDFSPGNIRITDNKEVALLDRNFYLELGAQDIGFFKKLLSSIANPEKLPGIVTDYLLSLPVNQSKVGQKAEIERKIAEVLQGKRGNWEKVLVDSLIAVRGLGIKMPLEITLLIKNLKVLNNLARKAGFGSLIEAVFYRQNPEALGGAN